MLRTGIETIICLSPNFLYVYVYVYVTFPMTSTDPYPGFQGHGIFEDEYLKNGAFYGQCYKRTLIGNHTQSIELSHFQ